MYERKSGSVLSRRLTMVLAIAVTLGLVGSVSSNAQRKSPEGDSRDSIRLGATLVQVPVVVTDRAGRFVTDLSRTDFSVSEDGIRQHIDHFTAVQQPFSAVLVIDTSNSAQDRLTAIQNVAVTFAEQIGPDDRLMVISFDNEIRQLTDFTSDHAEIKAAIKGTESGFGKLLYEGVSAALDRLSGVEGRRAVILFSDGVDMRSIAESAESTIRKAEELQIVIYVVKFETRWWVEAQARSVREKSMAESPYDIDARIPLPPEYGGPDPTPNEFPSPRKPRIEVGQRSDPPVVISDGTRSTRIEPPKPPPDDITRTLDKLYGEADNYVKALTVRTGGLAFLADSYRNTRSAFSAIAEELRNQYLIGYYQPEDRKDGKYHRISVKVPRREVKVRARPGYRAPKQSDGT